MFKTFKSNSREKSKLKLWRLNKNLIKRLNKLKKNKRREKELSKLDFKKRLSCKSNRKLN